MTRSVGEMIEGYMSPSDEDRGASPAVKALLEGYQVGSLKVSPGLVLAPMSGVTTSAFRRLIRRLNPGSVGLLMSEFVSIEAMTRKVQRTFDMMKYREEERPFAIQIFGHDIERMRESAMMVEQTGADLIDINCGCPVPKVVKKGGGCELMRQPTHLSKIIATIRKSISIPLTVKIRSGWDHHSQNALEIGRIAEAEGADGIAIHGRTRSQLYRGDADWEIVRELSESVGIPVFGSGDVKDRKSAEERMDQGRVAGLFIGRAAMSNPFVFDEVLNSRVHDLKKDPLEVVRILELYIDLLLEDYEPRGCVGKVKQLTSQMAKGHPWRKLICRVNTLEEQQQILEDVKTFVESGESYTQDEWSVPQIARSENRAVV